MTSFFSRKVTKIAEVVEEVPKVSNTTPKSTVNVESMKKVLNSVNSNMTDEIPTTTNGKSSLAKNLMDQEVLAENHEVLSANLDNKSEILTATNGKSSPPKNLKGQVEVLAENTDFLGKNLDQKTENLTGTNGKSSPPKNLNSQAEILAEKAEVLKTVAAMASIGKNSLPKNFKAQKEIQAEKPEVVATQTASFLQKAQPLVQETGSNTVTAVTNNLKVKAEVLAENTKVLAEKVTKTAQPLVQESERNTVTAVTSNLKDKAEDTKVLAEKETETTSFLQKAQPFVAEAVRNTVETVTKNLKGQVKVLEEVEVLSSINTTDIKETLTAAKEETGSPLKARSQVEVLAEKSQVLVEKVAETASFFQTAQSLVVKTGKNTVEAVTKTLSDIKNISPVKQVPPVSNQNEEDSDVDVTGQFEFLKNEEEKEGKVAKQVTATTKGEKIPQKSEELIPKETEIIGSLQELKAEKAPEAIKLIPEATTISQELKNADQQKSPIIISEFLNTKKSAVKEEKTVKIETAPQKEPVNVSLQKEDLQSKVSVKEEKTVKIETAPQKEPVNFSLQKEDLQSKVPVKEEKTAKIETAPQKDTTQKETTGLKSQVEDLGTKISPLKKDQFLTETKATVIAPSSPAGEFERVLRSNASIESWAETEFHGELSPKISFGDLKFSSNETTFHQEVPVYTFSVAPVTGKSKIRKTVIGIKRQVADNDVIGYNLIKVDGFSEEILNGPLGFDQEQVRTYELTPGRYILVPLSSKLSTTQFSIRIFVQN